MEKMQAVRKLKPKKGVDITEVDVPKPGPNQILVEVKSAPICGTDVHIYDFEPPWDSKIVLPKTLGHEMAGEILELGSGVKGFQVGDLISAESHIYCGQCRQCKMGNGHICENLKFYSIHADGFFAKYALVEQQTAWKNPKGMDPIIASLQESLGNSVYVVQESDVKDKIVAIYGLGATGLFATKVAKHLGAKQIIGVGGTDTHRGIAKAMGADVIINRHEQDPVKEILELTNGLGADVVLEMAGLGDSFKNALNSVRPVGQLTMLGLPKKPETIDLSSKIVLKDITFRGVYGRHVWRTWETMSKLLKDGLDITPMITHKLKIDEFEKGIETIKKSQSGKVIILP